MCWVSFETAQKHFIHVFLSCPLSSSLGLCCWTLWLTFQWPYHFKPLALSLSVSVSFVNLWSKRLLLYLRLGYILSRYGFHFSISLEAFFHLSLLFQYKFLRGKRHMSYCSSDCGRLKMYKTPRHDHFLWLKPLKKAPYFSKPIDLLSMTVHLSRNHLLSQPEYAALTFLPDAIQNKYSNVDHNMPHQCDEQTTSTWLWGLLGSKGFPLWQRHSF